MSSATPKHPEDHRKLCWMAIIIFPVKKTFTTVGQIKNTLQEVGVFVSKPKIKRRQRKYRDVNHWRAWKQEDQIRVYEKIYPVLEKHQDKCRLSADGIYIKIWGMV